MQGHNHSSVSVVIPCRNEEKFIGACLESLVAQDYPKEKMEVLVVDGRSSDGTREIVGKYASDFSFIKLLDNPKMMTPFALNTGVRSSTGDCVMILGSHSRTAPDFIRKNIESLNRNIADCVGGILITLPGDDTLLAETISLAVSHPFGIGNAYFRTGSREPRYVDTVPFGCYRKETFQKIGLFDEDLARNQDDEFNMRLIKNKGKVLLVPEIISYYHARDSLSRLFRMYFQYGHFKPLVAMKVGGVLTLRQVVPALFVGSLIAAGALSLVFTPLKWLFLLILSSYLMAVIGFSLPVAFRRGMKHIVTLPVVFATLHFSYGAGYLKGIWDFIVMNRHKRKILADVPLTR
ncbi:MAG: glycosyltransferase family 2 protein [Nitrospirae bacterium]|nr:glycosyltransferase family 2 protein [Nitrospirota bacterium]